LLEGSFHAAFLVRQALLSRGLTALLLAPQRFQCFDLRLELQPQLFVVTL
jgi:hypothetical protein